MTALTLDHVALPIFDVEKSLEFYGKALGLPLVDAMSGDDWGGKEWLMMLFGLSDDRQLVLVAIAGATRETSALPRDTRHVAFSVKTDEQLAEWKAKLDAAGVAFWEEIHHAQRSIYFEDPNGIVLEILTPPSRVSSLRPEMPPSRAMVERFLASTRKG